MMQRKHKVSLSLSADLVEWIDRQAAREKDGSRSGVVEKAMRRSARRSAAKEIEDATVAYYESMTPEEKAEDAAWARMSTEDFFSRGD